jgi:hypothetical protein
MIIVKCLVKSKYIYVASLLQYIYVILAQGQHKNLAKTIKYVSKYS